jgi:methylated-DNA-protein-cysteine methyltransferase-like protein
MAGRRSSGAGVSPAPAGGRSEEPLTIERLESGRSGALPRGERLYERIYAVVRQIPYGHVASYGQIARIVGNCTARWVGYAMAATPLESDIPWQRVINSQGKISPRSSGRGAEVQRELLELEGVRFDERGRVDFERYGWTPPEPPWEES